MVTLRGPIHIKAGKELPVEVKQAITEKKILNNFGLRVVDE